MKKDDLKFHHFLEFFPEIELPVTLTEEGLLEMSRINTPVPIPFLMKFVDETIGEAEMEEYVPCFRLPDTADIHAIVYWRAGLLNYEYLLATYDNSGNLIERKVIGGTVSNGQTIIKSVATIDPDWIIHVIAGEANAKEKSYDATKSKAFTMELLATGEIIFSLNEKNL